MNITPGQKFGEWVLISRIGYGSNGEVWKCKNEQDEKAIKILKHVNKISYGRFKREIETINELSGSKGILPIIDYEVPELDTGNTPYYVMPIAEPAIGRLKKLKFRQKLDAFIGLSETIKICHEREIGHRDIKPENILYLDGEFFVADFGLAKKDDGQYLSVNENKIGPWKTIAPEMRRNPETEPYKADVFSLAKTFWIFLSEREESFDGQFVKIDSLVFDEKYKDEYLTPLYCLFEKSTDHNPLKRPDIYDFLKELKFYVKLLSDWNIKISYQWEELTNNLFPLVVPNSAKWLDIEAIISILDRVSKYSDLNHMFYPSGGGVDLDKVKQGREDGSIIINDTEIMFPEKLTLECFPEGEWNYFRLKLKSINPVFKESEGRHREYLVEYDSNEYTNVSYESAIELERELQTGRKIKNFMRYMNGTFVIFAKNSPYNTGNYTIGNKKFDAYEAYNKELGENEFREFINKLRNT